MEGGTKEIREVETQRMMEVKPQWDYSMQTVWSKLTCYIQINRRNLRREKTQNSTAMARHSFAAIFFDEKMLGPLTSYKKIIR